MSTGLLALLDDVAAIAKVAAASLDDVAGQAARAGVKAAGVVIDDTAVTPRYLVGFAAERELPIVGRIALGSLRNKLLVLTPAVLALDALAPWAVLPLLTAGGAFLCYEGAEKLAEALLHHDGHGGDEPAAEAGDGATLEDAKVSGAVRTDFILSAEIMAIALGAIPEGTLVSKAVALTIVALGITAGVYGAVALIVKADDAGLALARVTSPSAWGRAVRGLGRLLVRGMPVLLSALSAIGTAAMAWVGGGMVLHGLEAAGYGWPAHLVHDAAHAAAGATPAMPGAVEWIVSAAGAGIFGLAVGGLLVPVVSRVVAPAWNAVAGLVSRMRGHGRPEAAE